VVTKAGSVEGASPRTRTSYVPGATQVSKEMLPCGPQRRRTTTDSVAAPVPRRRSVPASVPAGQFGWGAPLTTMLPASLRARSTVVELPAVTDTGALAAVKNGRLEVS